METLIDNMIICTYRPCVSRRQIISETKF